MGLNFLKKTGAKRQAAKLNESLFNAAIGGEQRKKKDIRSLFQI